MIGPVVLQLYLVSEALLEVQRVHGTAFLLRMLEALDKPWLVKRH